MRFLHLSDLHLGLRLYNRDLLEDQTYILNQIADAAERKEPDGLVIAGDIYDRAIPSVDAVEMFDRFITTLQERLPRTEIMIISGNHDSGPRVNLFRTVLSRQNIHMIGLPPEREGDHIEKVTLRDQYGPVNFYLLPFVKPSMVKQIVGPDSNGNLRTYQDSLKALLEREQINETERNVLVSHQFYLPFGADPSELERMDSEIVTVGNIDAIDAGLLKKFDYAALGHIHKPMKVGSDMIRYCGTPLQYSVSEAGQSKGILCVEMKEKGSIKIQELPLTPLREVKVIRGTLHDILQQGCSDYVSIRLTGLHEEDAVDMQDRIRSAFPNLLEIRRENPQNHQPEEEIMRESLKNPFSLCCEFMKDTDDKDRELLRDVINAVSSGQQFK